MTPSSNATESTLPLTRGAKGNRTQWTAQFLVAAELVRRGYVVAFTMGNHTPDADLMVRHLDTGAHFLVDVKGLSSSNAWLLGVKPDKKDLYYVLVFVGKSRDKDRFFILSQGEGKELIRRYEQNHPNQKPLISKGLSGFNFGDVANSSYEARWDKFPSAATP